MEFAKLSIDLENNKILLEKLDVNIITSNKIFVYDSKDKKYVNISRDYENKVIEDKTLNKIAILVELSPIGIHKAKYIIQEKLEKLNRKDLIDIIEYSTFIGFFAEENL